MPLIPLPTRSNPLANAPAPVLDRERRPTVDNRGVINAVGALGSVKMPELPQELADNSGLVAIGRAIGQAGNVLGALAIKEREAQTDIQVAHAARDLRLERANFDEWRINNPDPATWKEEWNNRWTAFQTRALENDKLTPEARKQIGVQFTHYDGESRADVQKLSATRTFDIAQSEFLAVAEEGIEEQNAEKVESALTIGLEKGYLFPHQAAAKRLRFREVGEQKKRQAAAQAFDTAQNFIISEAATKGSDAAVKAIDEGIIGKDLDEANRERLRAISKQVGNARAGEVMDQVTDLMMQGEMNSPEKIDAFIADNPHVSPALRAKMKAEFSDWNRIQNQEDIAVNGIKYATELRHKILSLDPSADKDRTRQFEVYREIAARAPKEMQQSLRADLRRRYSGEVDKPVQDLIDSTINIKFDPVTGLVPYKTKEFRTDKYATDKDPWFGKGHKKGEVKLDEEGKPIIRTDKHGEEQFKWVEDPQARLDAERAETIVRQKMKQWQIANPDKVNNPVEVQKAINGFLPDGKRGQRLRILQERARAVPTAATGKVTSYGYEGDSTPDSNSRDGIGAFVPDDEAAKIRRGEYSDYKLQKGDIAVSPDVEKEFRAAGVKPGDNVLVELANGTTRLARWMDLTAQDEQILRGEIKGVTKPLRGRFDFYNPKGKDPLDGVAVVGWKPVTSMASR